MKTLTVLAVVLAVVWVAAFFMLASSLLATRVLATDVEAVHDRYGIGEQRAIVRATPAPAGDLPARATGPKVEVLCRFVERTGGLDERQGMLAGHTGTQVPADGPEIEYADGGA
jgi:carbamate kinase